MRRYETNPYPSRFCPDYCNRVIDAKVLNRMRFMGESNILHACMQAFSALNAPDIDALIIEGDFQELAGLFIEMRLCTTRIYTMADGHTRARSTAPVVTMNVCEGASMAFRYEGVSVCLSPDSGRLTINPHYGEMYDEDF